MTPAELLQRLIRFDTTNPPGAERELVEFLAGLLRDAGIEDVKVLGADPERPNRVARLPGEGSAPPLLLQGHADVVPVEGQRWTHPPFEGRIVDGHVWGRGALDMKGGVAMMVSALLAKAPNVIPIPGSSRPETIRSSVAAAELRLSEDQLARLDVVSG